MTVRSFELACEEFRADTVLRVSEILQREGIESKFKIGYIDVDSGENVYVSYPTWGEADDRVRTLQRNAIPAWHSDD